MADNASKKAGEYLEAKSQNLRSILAKVKQLNELNEHFLRFVDPNIAQLCRVANVMNDKLVVVAASGSIATQIRFEAMDLLRKFKTDPVLKGIKQIESKVRPSLAPTTPSKKPQREMQRLSQHTADMINDIADTLDDPRLKAALKRIAEYKKK